MPKRALVTGIRGQDGFYLTELLLAKGYEVHGLERSASQGIRDARVTLHPGDLADRSGLAEVFDRCRPDEVYNLGALSHVDASFDAPYATADINAMGVLRLLEIIRAFQAKEGKRVRFYQAGSSEMYGKGAATPLDEAAAFCPCSPYGAAKVFGFWQTLIHRESYGLYACNGILFNHESPRRPENYVSRKITRAAARIKLGLQEKLVLGNLESRRDWGFAGDYVEAMWLMLQQDKPGDYVVALGEVCSVGQFVAAAFERLGLDWKKYVEQDRRFFRPTDVDSVCGDASKARRVLGWKPKIDFKRLVAMMVDADMALASQERT